ncbi:MerR family transcriptional regulator [Bdellovibrio sp. HCB337]|uniref:MerR family transcriptional regulator n=1 Tax=Bdellovibrio sp. HCB337 TaxID=3394358 RepID=UPI0039A672CE
MKDWLTIGQFSKRVGVSAKALRIYEKMGLLNSHTRGDNGYRYYKKSQLELAYRLRDFNELGFTLNEIRGLLAADSALDFKKLDKALSQRLAVVLDEEKALLKKKNQLERILTSLKQKNEPLTASERKYIMTMVEKVSIVITGIEGLEQTAQKIQEHLAKGGLRAPVTLWDGKTPLPQEKPHILVVPEKHLMAPEVKNLNPEVIVVQKITSSTESLIQNYLNLFSFVGAHTTTIINADDESSVKLAGETLVKKGRIYYFSKNTNLEKQIRYIGGVVSDGEDITIYGFNRYRRSQMKLDKTLSLDEEIVLLSSLAAVMEIGLPMEKFPLVVG